MRGSIISLVIGVLALGIGVPGAAVQAGSEVVTEESDSARADLAQAMAFRMDLSLDASPQRSDGEAGR